MRSLPAVVSNSWEGRDFLVDKFRLPKERVRVINNGVEIPVDVGPSNWRQRLGIAPNDIVFTMTANLSAFKDHLTLLHAFARLRQSEIGRRCRLILAGRQDETTQQIKALAFDLGLCGAVILPGVVPMNETGSLLQATDVVVHSSIKEGCPNAALEAMAHGRCVLGTDISGMRQALGEVASANYLSPPGDAGGLFELMQQMANDPAGREAAGHANLARVRVEFSVEKMTEAVLETILDHRIR
jgi:glycosyltransferase involved in cell wall biosynthesis